MKKQTNLTVPFWAFLVLANIGFMTNHGWTGTFYLIFAGIILLIDSIQGVVK